MHIVIAWTEPDVTILREGRPDIGQLPLTAPSKRALACTWILDGTATDVERAAAYVASFDDGRVYTFESVVELAEARRRVLREATP